MPRILSRDKALLIVCTVLNPFVSSTYSLLNENDGECSPIAGAGKLKIDNFFANLYRNDQKYNLKTIDFIINSILHKCKQEGFSIMLDEEELVGRAFGTVDELADRLADTSMPIRV